MAGSNSASSLANSRSVGISPLPGRSLSSIRRGRQQCPGREKRQLIEGALALPGEGASPPACLALGVGIKAVLPTSAADAASRSRHLRAAASVGRR